MNNAKINFFYTSTPSIILFVACLPFEGFSVENKSSWNGFGILLVGIFSGSIYWYANLLLFAAWGYIKLKMKIPACIASSAAVILSFSFLFAVDVIVDEGGGKQVINGYLTGYWLWLLSMIFAFISAVLMRKNDNSLQVQSKVDQ